MKATGLFAALMIGTLLSSSKTVLAKGTLPSSSRHLATTKDPSACPECKPVVNVNADGNGKCDLCKLTGELHEEMKKLKSELSSVKSQLSQIQPVCNPPQTALMFPNATTTDYVIKYGMPSLTSVTACFWMKSTDQVNSGTPLSYAVPGRVNELVIFNYNAFSPFINQAYSTTSVSATDGKWHHICVTWENYSGSWKVYKDGVEEAKGSGLKTDHVIRGGGALVLGQEQDSVGGGFESYQTFVGELTGVNIWDHVLGASEIASLAKSCSAGEGNVFKWSDFTPHVKGGVQLITSTCQA